MINRLIIPSKARLVSILIMPALILFYFFLHPALLKSQEEGGESVKPEDLEVKVKTATLKTGELPITVKATGTYIPLQQSPAIIVSRVSGIVTKINAKDGETVKAGQIITSLDDRITKANYEKARTAFQTAEAELKNAENGGLDIMQADLDVAAKDAAVASDKAQLESKHEDELLADNLTSSKAAQDARNAMEIAVEKSAAETKKAELFHSNGRDIELKRLKAAYAQAQAEFKSAQLDFSSSTITSPMNGRISGLKLSIGALVDEKTVVGQIAGDNASAFQLWVSPKDAKTLQVGNAATIYGASSIVGIKTKIVSTGGGVDAETGLVPIITQSEGGQSDSLHLGEAVTADIVSGSSQKGFIIPVSALTVEDENASVFMVDKKNLAHAVSITILVRNAEKAVIQSENLKEGDIIITDGNYNLPDGAAVTEEKSK
jgi:multidrug efflux pump subunit AcrA (membrane-fusion protein)